MRSITIALVAATLLAGSAPADAAKEKPTPCPAARFVVDGDPLVGEPVPLADAVAYGPGAFSVESGCGSATKVKVRAKKKVTLVNARWSACEALGGKAKLVARIDAASCATISGTLRAPKRKLKRPFTGRIAGAPTLTPGAFTDAALDVETIGPGGGTITVLDPGGPLDGLSIVIPAGATGEPITFSIAWADVTSEGLPRGAAPASKLIRIEARGSEEWNQYRMFDLPVLVTLPYGDGAGSAEESIRYYVQNGDGSLEPAGFERIDPDDDTISFYTRAFADAAEASRLGVTTAAAIRPNATSSAVFNAYVAIGLAEETLAALANGRSVDTGFRPSMHGWRIPNYGSYYKHSRGGSCFGFVGGAQWYYRKSFRQRLYDTYRDPDASDTWVDDAVAIEFTSRVHNGMADIWDQYVSGEVNIQQPSSRAVALSWVGAMYVTGAPALLYIQQALAQAGGAIAYSGAHAISVYRVDITAVGGYTFHAYDPNFPGDDGRRISYTTSTGFVSYPSGATAGESPFLYNYFKHVGFHVGLSDAVLQAIKTAADRGFAGESVFPRVMISAVTNGKSGLPATEGTTAEGDHKWIVEDNAVRIEGTIAGGLAQDACCVVGNARIFLSNKRYSFPVNNQAGGGDGAFSALVPIQQGESELVIIGATQNSFSHWAAFHRDVIESTFSAAALEVTLGWSRGQSDVDLYVQEPDSDEGDVGDTVYYAHRRGADPAHPYLDFDNTSGYGPEHYLGLPGTTSLYDDGSPAPSLHGTYTVGVHYYADHDDDPESDQVVPWNVHWRYLAFCPEPCTDPEANGIWREGTRNGVLATASSGQCCNIDDGGASWSSLFTIDYPEPDPDDYAIPDPPGVMLP